MASAGCYPQRQGCITGLAKSFVTRVTQRKTRSAWSARPLARTPAPAGKAAVRSGHLGGRSQLSAIRTDRCFPWLGLGFDLEVSVVGADGHEEVVQEALEPGEAEGMGPWIAEPDWCVPGEVVGAVGHGEVDAG